MKNHKRLILSGVIGMALGVQFESVAFAESTKNIVLASITSQTFDSVYYQAPKSDWGWWVKDDWHEHMQNGLPIKSLKMLDQAAKSGNAQAQFVMGMFYSYEDRLDDATYWLSRAAKQGHANAEFTYNYYINMADDFGIGC